MADDSAAATIGKFGLGLGAGFGLYWLIRNLGFGRGGGFGGGPGDREAGQGPEAPHQAPIPAPVLPKDAEPLLFVVLHPEGVTDFGKGPDVVTRARRDAVAKRVDLGTETLTPRDIYRRAGAVIRDKSAKPLSIDELIARVKAGSRDDVRLINMGSIRSGTWDDVLDALMNAGINHWRLWEQAPADRQPSGQRPAEPPKGPKWDLYTKSTAADNPDKNGHYLFNNVGTAYWGLDRRIDGKEPPLVSGYGRGQYGTFSVGRGHYR